MQYFAQHLVQVIILLLATCQTDYNNPYFNRIPVSTAAAVILFGYYYI